MENDEGMWHNVLGPRCQVGFALQPVELDGSGLDVRVVPLRSSVMTPYCSPQTSFWIFILTRPVYLLWRSCIFRVLFAPSSSYCIKLLRINGHTEYVLRFLCELLHLQIYCSVKRILLEKNEMGGECSAYGWEERCIQGFGGETCGKESTWKTRA